RLYGGTYLVALELPADGLEDAEHARIEGAFATLNGLLGQFGITLAEFDPTTWGTPDVQLRLTDRSVIGGAADGILGVTEVGGRISILTGWDYYLGADTGAVGAGQYDFQTVVTHELGHAV